MKRDMALMDAVHAWTFEDKIKGVKINLAMVDVQRVLRAKLRAAEG